MTRVLVLLSRLLLLLGIAGGLAGQAAADDTEMIVGGKPAPAGKYPFQVRLYQSPEDQRGSCGGTLIGDRWVLTAAHCIVVDPHLDANLVPVESVVVGYGNVDRTATTKVESEKIVVHPDYLKQGFKANSDIALIKLKEPVADVDLIEFADAETDLNLVKPGTKVTVTGWGAIWDPEDKDIVELLSKLTASPEELGERLNFPRKLHEADIHVMDREECRTVYQASQLGIADTEICALKPRSVANACYGDSGGPLLALASNPRRYVQIGVVSWGDRCGRVGNPNVYARVSSFSDWIKETMGAAEEPDTGAPATMTAE